MIGRGLAGRLGRLEDLARDGRADRAAEARAYGELAWSVPGARCYVRDGFEGAEITTVGTGGIVRLAVVGVRLDDL